MLFLFSGVATAENRVALLIGNANYPDDPLKNPLNDLRDMSRVLKSLDFDVMSVENAGRKSMLQAVDQFNRQLGRGTVSFFYYAGHGVQIKGENYLIPVDAAINSVIDVQYDAMSLDRVLKGIRNAKGGLNLVVLDACRNNPYLESTRSMARGLAKAEPASIGTMIMYAAQPGNVALDGQGENGVFTGELIRVLEERPELRIEQLFKYASKNVHKKTKGRQTPWSEGNILVDFAFKKTEKLEPVTSAISPVPIEQAVWNEAKAGNTVGDYRAYLNQYPNGFFSYFAKSEITKLESKRRKNIEEQELVKAQKTLNRIKELIGVIERNIDSNMLTSPANNNANSRLNELALIEPDHPFVLQGRERIQTIYSKWIENRLEVGDLSKADSYLNSLLLVSGSDEKYAYYKNLLELAVTADFEERELARTESEKAQNVAVNERSENLEVKPDQAKVLISQIFLDLKASNLTTPRNGNANNKLNKLEALDSAHPFLKDGRQLIRNRYIEWIQKQLDQENFDEARAYLKSLALVKNSEDYIDQYGRLIDTANSRATSRGAQIGSESNNSASEFNVVATPIPMKSIKFTAKDRQYDEDCSKSVPSAGLKILGIVTRNIVKKSEGRTEKITVEDLSSVDLDGGGFAIYTDMRLMEIKKYTFSSRLYSPKGELFGGVVSWVIDNKETLSHRYNWARYAPNEKVPLGEWKYVVCEGGARHLVKNFVVTRNK